MMQAQIKWKRMGPFDKIWSFGDSWLLAILQKFPTSTMHNFFNFELLEVFLDFFRKLEMSYNQPFWSHLILIFHAQVRSFDKKGVFVDFSKWPIMSKFITSCEWILWTWGMNMDCRKLHPIQNELWMGHFS